MRSDQSAGYHRLRMVSSWVAFGLLGCSPSGHGASPAAKPTLPAIQSAVVCPPTPVHAGVVNPPRHFTSPPGTVISPASGYCAYLATARGVIAIRLRPEFVPIAVNNFVYLAQRGFY